jgi:tetratricopeptide (TPR) repeat protein
MRFLSFGKKELTDDQLRETLFDLVAAVKTRKLKKVISEHQPRLRTLFPTWTVVPSEVRRVPDRTTWWAEGMIGVASAAHQLGDGSLFALLQGEPRDNVLVLWREALITAQAEVDCQNYLEAIRILEEALNYADGLEGTGRDDYLPKHYGLLGTTYFLAGNRESARTYTVKAKNYCERIGDREGMAIYTGNLARIDSA